MTRIRGFESRDCQHTQKLLDHFLAGELSVETNQEILAHLEHCPDCRREEESRIQVRGLLKEAWATLPVPGDLEGRIIGDLVPQSKTWSGFLRMAAGFFIFVVALGVFISLLSPLGRNSGVVMALDHYDEAIDDHVNCSGSVAARNAVLPLDSVEVEMEQSLSRADHPYQLTEKRLCRVDGVRFVHYVFRGRNQSMSLILEEKSEHRHVTIGDAEEEAFDGLRVALLEVGESLGLVYAETPGYFVYLVSEEVEPERVLRLTQRILPSLVAAL